MVGNWNKTLRCFAALIIVFVFVGCEKEKREIETPAGTASKHTLTYTVGEHGSIEGISPQTVIYGKNGSMVTAVPAAGYHFVEWNDGVTTKNRTDSDVRADITVRAVFHRNEYTLTYSAGEKGSIEGPTVQNVAHGDDAKPVKAVPAANYHFTGWSDGVDINKRTDQNVMDDLEVAANFAIDQYTLTYSAGEKGSIRGANPQTVDHGGKGSAVTAVPAKSYHFVEWSDGVTVDKRTDSDVTADLQVTASFALNLYTLSYIPGPNGSIEGSVKQKVEHGRDGTPVTAVPADHHHFVNWNDGVTTASRVEHNVTADHELTANFDIDRYNLTYTTAENGAIKGATPQTVDHGGKGSAVTAVPDAGYHFLSWSDGLDTASRIDRDVTADQEVTANFAINQYTLKYIAGENGFIDGPDHQIVDHGGIGATITAEPDKGYHFLSWSDGISTAERTDSEVSGDLTVSAAFEVNTYTVGGSVSGLIAGTKVIVQNNGSDDLEITANGDFHFATELLNAQLYEVRVLSQPTTPNQICTVNNGNGTIPDENVNDVVVTCVPVTYTIGGKVSGLPDGDRLLLQNNETDNIVIKTNGFFSFTTPLDDGSNYKVTINGQPEKPNWICVLENGDGTLAGMDVKNIIVDCFPKVVLQAAAGIRKITLNWNSQDFNGVIFNLCIAQEDFTNSEFSKCNSLEDGDLKRKVDSPLTLAELTNDITYWLQIEARYKSGRQTLSEIVTAIPFGGLNDTGIDWCADDTTNRFTEGTKGEKKMSCTTIAATHPGQDAQYGRDAAARAYKLSKVGSGSAGFDFTKVCMSGEAAGEGDCPPNPALGVDDNDWACTLDNVTGLLWEVKTNNGLRKKSNSYSWFNPDDTKNGGAPGQQNGGICEESGCDTQAFVQAVNTLGLCGASNWRLPTRKELLSITNNSRFEPSVDRNYFPNTLAGYYWSSSPYAENTIAAWQVYFKYGEAYTDNKNQTSHVRLVHGRTVTFGFDNP